MRAFVAVALAVIAMVVAGTQPLAACTGGSCGGIGGILKAHMVTVIQ